MRRLVFEGAIVLRAGEIVDRIVGARVVGASDEGGGVSWVGVEGASVLGVGAIGDRIVGARVVGTSV